MTDDSTMLCRSHRNLGKFMVALVIHRLRLEVGAGTGLTESPRSCVTMKMVQQLRTALCLPSLGLKAILSPKA